MSNSQNIIHVPQAAVLLQPEDTSTETTYIEETQIFSQDDVVKYLERKGLSSDAIQRLQTKGVIKNNGNVEQLNRRKNKNKPFGERLSFKFVNFCCIHIFVGTVLCMHVHRKGDVVSMVKSASMYEPSTANSKKYVAYSNHK